MSDFQTILRLARRSLLVLGGSLLVALAAYLASGYFKDRLQTQLTTVQQTVNAQQATLSEKQTDLANLQTEIDRFNQLRQAGGKSACAAASAGMQSANAVTSRWRNCASPGTPLLACAKPAAKSAVVMATCASASVM